MKMQKGSQHSGHMMPAATDKNIRALKITSILTGVYFIIELGIGIYTGSIAVLSDLFHTFSAVGGVLLALAAGRIAMRPVSPEGSGRKTSKSRLKAMRRRAQGAACRYRFFEEVLC